MEKVYLEIRHVNILEKIIWAGMPSAFVYSVIFQLNIEITNTVLTILLLTFLIIFIYLTLKDRLTLDYVKLSEQGIEFSKKSGFFGYEQIGIEWNDVEIINIDSFRGLGHNDIKTTWFKIKPYGNNYLLLPPKALSNQPEREKLFFDLVEITTKHDPKIKLELNHNAKISRIW